MKWVCSDSVNIDGLEDLSAMEKLGIYSPNSLVYVLVHKMDKIPSDMKRSVGFVLPFHLEIGFLHRKG